MKEGRSKEGLGGRRNNLSPGEDDVLTGRDCNSSSFTRVWGKSYFAAEKKSEENYHSSEKGK